MQLSNFLNLKGKTKFRLRLELTLTCFSLLVAQALFLISPPLDQLVSLLAMFWMIAACKEIKSRREPFTRRQKHAIFGLNASLCGAVLLALLVAGIVKPIPFVWILFGLAAVLFFVLLFYEYDTLYNDDSPPCPVARAGATSVLTTPSTSAAPPSAPSSPPST